MYRSSGILYYYPSGWMVLKVSDSIILYYKYWVQKSLGIKLNAPRSGAHITVVAGKYENPSLSSLWNKYHGDTIDFEYNCNVQQMDHYFWIEVKSQKLKEIRNELGLSDRPYYPFHLTVGNTLNL